MASTPTPTTPATGHHAYAAWAAKGEDIAAFTDEALLTFVIRPAADVIRALHIPYSGALYKVNGNDYIPWNITVSILSEIYGDFGWSIHEVYTREWEDDGKKGYECLIALTVRCLMPDGSIVSKTIQKSGVSEIKNMANGMDTALKACRSDARSVACKELGPAFGLYLYEKETAEEQPKVYNNRPAAAAPQPTGTWNRPQAQQAPTPLRPTDGDRTPVYVPTRGGKPVYPKQYTALQNMGFPAEFYDEEGFSSLNASDAMKAVYEQHVSPDDHLRNIGFYNRPALVAANDRPY